MHCKAKLQCVGAQLHNCIATWVHHCLAASRVKMLMRLILRKIHHPLPIQPQGGGFGQKWKPNKSTTPRLSGSSSPESIGNWMDIFNAGNFETSCPGPKVDQGPSYDLVTALNLRGVGGLQLYGLQYYGWTTCWIAIQHWFGRFEVADVCKICQCVPKIAHMSPFQQILVPQRHWNSVDPVLFSKLHILLAKILWSSLLYQEQSLKQRWQLGEGYSGANKLSQLWVEICHRPNAASCYFHLTQAPSWLLCLSDNDPVTIGVEDFISYLLY